jgi:hypothetical protein
MELAAVKPDHPIVAGSHGVTMARRGTARR